MYVARSNFRKLDLDDFNARVRNIDPKYARLSPAKRHAKNPWETTSSKMSGESPKFMALLAFGSCIGIVFAQRDPDAVAQLMRDWGWPAAYLDYVVQGIAVIAIALLIVFGGNVLRMFNRSATGRKNAIGWTVGTLAAIGALNLPPEVVETGRTYAETHGAVVWEYAQARSSDLSRVDWDSVIAVSSLGK